MRTPLLVVLVLGLIAVVLLVRGLGADGTGAAIPRPVAPGEAPSGGPTETPSRPEDRNRVDPGAGSERSRPGPDDARENAVLEVVGRPVQRGADPQSFVGTIVELVGDGGRRNQVQRLDDRLTAVFQRVDPAWTYDLVVRPENALVATVEALVLDPGERRRVEVDLSRGARVFGRVVDPDGQPVGGEAVQVFVEVDDEPQRLHRSLQTEEGGDFDVSGIPAGQVVLRTRIAGVLPTELVVGRLGDGQVVGPVELRLDRGAVLEGVLRWPDGAPVEPATVVLAWRLQGDGASPARRGASTDEEGRFRFDGLTAGRYDLVARPLTGRGDLPGSEDWRAWVDDVGPGAHELRLGPGLAVAGTVTDDIGAPVPSFRVVSEPVLADGVRPGVGYETVETVDSPDGTFRLVGLRPGTHLLTASDRAGSRTTRAELFVTADRSDVVLVLPRPARVEGVVRDAGGVGLEGVWVYAVPVGQGAGDEVRAPRRALSRAGGEFLIERVAPGTVLLKVEAAEGPGQEVMLDPGEHRRGVVLLGR